MYVTLLIKDVNKVDLWKIFYFIEYQYFSCAYDLSLSGYKFRENDGHELIVESVTPASDGSGWLEKLGFDVLPLLWME